MIPLFELDPDQSGVPEGRTAYLVRDWHYAFDAGTCVDDIVLEAGGPRIIISSASPSGPSSEPAISRVFVLNDAKLDPALFLIPALPIPKRLLERDESQSDVPAVYGAYFFCWYHSVTEGALVSSVRRTEIRLRFDFEVCGLERAARFRGEGSRLFVRDGGIDPRAFALLAMPWPDRDPPKFVLYDAFLLPLDPGVLPGSWPVVAVHIAIRSRRSPLPRSIARCSLAPREYARRRIGISTDTCSGANEIRRDDPGRQLGYIRR